MGQIVDSNHRPLAYQANALTNAIGPNALWQLNRRSERGTISSQLMLGAVVHHHLVYKKYEDDVLVTSLQIDNNHGVW